MAKVNVDEVSYVISATDVTDQAIASAKAGLRTMQDTSQNVAAQMEAHWVSFQRNWKGIVASIVASGATLKQGWDMSEMAASHYEQMGLLDGLAKKYDTTSDKIVSDIRRTGEGMIGMAKAAEVSAEALSRGMNPTQVNNLAHAATVLADLMKSKVETAFEDLTQGVERGRLKTLQAAVGIIDLKDRYGDLADKMSDTEKATAMYNIVMERVAQIEQQTGMQTKTLADRMEAFRVTLKDTQIEIGVGLIRATTGGVGALQTMAASVLMLVQGYANLLGMIHEVRSVMSFGDAKEWHLKAVQEYKEMAAAASGASAELIEKASKNFNLMSASAKELTGAMSAGAASTKMMADTEGQRAGVVKETVTHLEALSKVMARVGEDELKMSKEVFVDKLKEENVTLAAMRASLDGYLTTLKSVYDQRIAGEKAVADAMAKAGAKPEDQMRAQVQTLNMEKAYLTERLAGWKGYYDALAGQHKTATDLMATKTKELQALDAKGAEDRRAQITMQQTMQEKLFAAQGKAMDDVSIGNAKRLADEELYTQAMSKTGEERIKGLQAYIDSLAKTSGAEYEYSTKRDIWTGKEITQKRLVRTEEENITGQIEKQALAYTILNAEQLNSRMAKDAELTAVKNWRDALEPAMKTAKDDAEIYKIKLLALSDTISNMDKEIALKTDISQSTTAIGEIKGALKAIPDETVYVNIVQRMMQQVMGGSGSGSGTGQKLSVEMGPPGDPYNPGAPRGPFIVSSPDDSDGARIYTGSDGTPTLSNVGPPDPFSPWALGGAFDRGRIVNRYAEGDIVNKPTFFKTATGTGVMGEAGPEAIMPLTRGEDGKLGVKAYPDPYYNATHQDLGMPDAYYQAVDLGLYRPDVYYKASRVSGGTDPYYEATHAKPGPPDVYYTVVNHSPIININGSNKSPDELAREITKSVLVEIRKIESRSS